MNDFDKTMMFRVDKEEESEVAKILKEVYQALEEKGYKPIDQIVGYILSGDPAYITSHQDARSKIRRFERDEIIEELVKSYLQD
ncbi:IreB family regulatory phosphoprotein [Halanaerocella petrolearia]